MSVAAAQYSQFKEQVVRDAKVFTFTEEGEYLVYPVDGHEVIPFWSSRRRMQMIQKSFPKFHGFEITEMSLNEFLKWIPSLVEEKIHIGANWSGKRLTGYDVSVHDLLAGLQYLINRSDVK